MDPLLGIPNLEPASYVKRHRGRPVTNPRNPKLSQETRRLFAHPARCGTVLGLSAVTIGLTILAFKLLGDGVGSRLSLGSWIMIVPPITLIQLLPISFAGGVYEK